MRWVKRILIVLSAVLFVLAGTAAWFLRLPWIRTEPVSFSSNDVTLAGTLALPRSRAAPYPAAIVVHGSGALPRWIYWSYARHLVPHGMAVLLYDKRGVGASTGTYPQPEKWSPDTVANCRGIFEVLAQDTLAAVRLLRSRPDIDASRIGLAGISQAGWIMPMVAAYDGNLAYIVSISGPAVSCGVEDRYSQLTGEYAAHPEIGGPVPFEPGELSNAEIEEMLDEYEGPAGYDPLPVLDQLDVPMLWILGGRDRSVPTNRSIRNLQRLIEAGAPFDVRVFPDGNHVLARGDGQWPRIDYWSDVREWLTGRGILTAPQ